MHQTFNSVFSFITSFWFAYNFRNIFQLIQTTSVIVFNSVFSWIQFQTQTSHVLPTIKKREQKIPERERYESKAMLRKLWHVVKRWSYPNDFDKLVIFFFFHLQIFLDLVFSYTQYTKCRWMLISMLVQNSICTSNRSTRISYNSHPLMVTTTTTMKILLLLLAAAAAIAMEWTTVKKIHTSLLYAFNSNHYHWQDMQPNDYLLNIFALALIVNWYGNEEGSKAGRQAYKGLHQLRWLAILHYPLAHTHTNKNILMVRHARIYIDKMNNALIWVFFFNVIDVMRCT